MFLGIESRNRESRYTAAIHVCAGTVLLISFAPPYYVHSYANRWSVAQRQMKNGKWGKTAIKKVAARWHMPQA